MSRLISLRSDVTADNPDLLLQNQRLRCFRIVQQPEQRRAADRRVTGKRLFEAANAKKLTNSRVTFRAKAEVAHLSLRAGPCHEYHHTVRITL